MITVSSYLAGRPVFISDDGFLRDAGEFRGTISGNAQIERALELVYVFIIENQDSQFFFILDEPVSLSQKLAERITDFIHVNGLRGDTICCKSADNYITEKSEKNDLICTSDSLIIDKTAARIFDLPHYLLKKNFDIEIVDLSDYLDLS